MHFVHQRLTRASFGILIKLGLAGLSFMMLWLDIAVFDTQLLEISFTEITQEAMLFTCALLFWLAPAQPSHRGFNVLAGGFFACLLMRELDGLFDPISHSAWCWPFTAIALASLAIAFSPSRRVNTFETLAAFTTTPAFGAMSTGLGVLVFSRVFGMGAFWHLILTDGYARLAKTASEEGIELLTYAIWLAASLEVFFFQRVSARDEVIHPKPLGSRLVHEGHGR